MKHNKHQKIPSLTEAEVREAVQRFVKGGGVIRHLVPEHISPTSMVWPNLVPEHIQTEPTTVEE